MPKKVSKKGITNKKKRLREGILSRRGAVSTANRVIRSADILQRLFELEAMRLASWVHFYVSCGNEVETTGMIAHALKHGKRVSVPKMDTESNRLILSELKDPIRDLAPNAHGIPEPRPEAFRPVGIGEMNLIVAPGTAFDEKGYRIGQGGGYYDRLLDEISGRIPIVALAFELQIAPAVPFEKHDIPVDWIVTEKRVIHSGAFRYAKG